MGGVDNIPIITKQKINTTHLNEEESLLTRKADITLTINTLKKSSLQEMCMKSMYLIIMMNLMFNLTTWSLIFFVKQRLYEM